LRRRDRCGDGAGDGEGRARRGGRNGPLLRSHDREAPAEYNASNYRLSTFYDLFKTSVIRLAFAQGEELAPHGCTAVALTPGWLRSKMMLEN
jgi:NAD(P)-dependent dehydrogenase (short-subunit alcohol dehydrogenase family)